MQYFQDGDLADKIRVHADNNDHFSEPTVWKYYRKSYTQQSIYTIME